MKLIFLLFAFIIHWIFALKSYKIDINGWENFQTFDGFGAISGGGATSKLLFTYFPTEKERRKVMEVMFNPETGLQMLKVEMGGDDQSTEGSESSHMSEKGKISKNNYEFRLIREALDVNPSLPICVLPWTFPGWLGTDPYQNITQTAGYVVEWLRIGRDTWNFDTFCVGVWNERDFSEQYVRELRRVLNAAGFGETLIVAGEGFRMDESYSRLLNDSFIRDYEVMGVHYPGGKIPENVQKSGKTIWASEDFSTDNRDTGLGCMARTINWNFVNGNITGMLVWHLMSAFYPQLPWWKCGLASVTENGFRTENAFHVLKYVTGHVKRSWKLVPHGKGSGKFSGGGTFVSYTNGHHLTIFVETMTHEKSMCEYSSPSEYSVKSKQRIRFQVSAHICGLNVSLNFGKSRFLPVNSRGFVELELSKNAFGILTTQPVQVPRKISVLSRPLPSKYFDNFSNYEEDEEPRFWMPQKGSWRVENGRAVQKTTGPPISWCTAHTKTPYAVMAYRKAKSKLQVDVTIPEGSTAESVVLGIRSNCSGCDIEVTNCRGIFAEVNFQSGNVTVFADFVNRSKIAEIQTRRKIEFGKFYTFSVNLINSHFVIEFGTNLVFTSVEIPTKFLVETSNDTLFLIATGNFGISEWDNISVL